MNEMTEKELQETALEDEQAFQDGIADSIPPAEEFLVKETPVEIEPAKSRIGVTKKIYREKAQHKAAKQAKKMRQQNRRRNSHSRG